MRTRDADDCGAHGDATLKTSSWVVTSQKIGAAVLLLIATALVLGLWSAAPSYGSANPSVLRFTVIKRASTYVIVKRHAVRLKVRRGSRLVHVAGTPRYRVVRHTRACYWLRRLDTPPPTPTQRTDVSVTAFGAHPDGTTDDTRAIQAAVNACGTGGGTVTFPAGTYVVSSPIKLPAGNAALLTLSGYGAVIKLTSTTPRFLIWNTKASGLTFRHFRVQGFKVDAQGHRPASGSWSVVGFDCTWGRTSATNIEDVTVKDIATVNVPTMDNPQSYYAYNVNVYTSGTAHITDVLVQGCRLAGGTAGVSIIGADSASHVTMNRVYIRDCWHDTGLRFTRGGLSENYHIGQYAHVGTAAVTNCVGRNSADVGVEIDNASASIVSGCTMYDSWFDAFFYTNFTTPLSVGSDYCTFKNNAAIVDYQVIPGRPGCSGYICYNTGTIALGSMNFLNNVYVVADSITDEHHAAFDTQGRAAAVRSLTINGLAITDHTGLDPAWLVRAIVGAGKVTRSNISLNGAPL